MIKSFLIASVSSVLLVSSIYAEDVYVDNNTKLMWQDNKEAKATRKPWVNPDNYNDKNYNNTEGDTAASYCENLNLKSFNDWRLPSSEELVGIFKQNSKLNNVSHNNYWSSTSDTGMNNYRAWRIYFFSTGHSNFHNKNNNYNVRCVRTLTYK
jgi:hypothetical protein